MNSRQLGAFRAIVQTGTVSAAAVALHISQPAASRLLAHLEQQLDFLLFDRVLGRLRLTPEGHAFLREVDQHFLGLDVLRLAASRIALHGPGSIRAIAIPSVASSVLPDVMAQIIRIHPATAIVVDSETTDKIVARVAAAYDVGFTTATVTTDSAVSVRVLVSRPWAAVFPVGHHLSRRSEISLSELSDEPLVGFSPGMSLHSQLAQEFARVGIQPDFKISAQTIESICAMVASGIGSAVIHPYANRVAQRHGLKPVVLSDSTPLDLVTVTPVSQAESSLVSECIALARKHYAEEID